MKQKRALLDSPETGSVEFATKRFNTLSLAVLLAVLTAAAFSGVLRNEYVFFDDDGYVVQNPAVNNGLSHDSVRYAFTSFDLGNWIPVTWLSYMLNFEMFGGEPFGFHLVDVALHILNVILLFVVLAQATQAVGRSWCCALLWGLHPLRVESVAWIAERKDLLSGLFLMLMILAWMRFQQTRKSIWFLWTVLSFLLGLLSKPMLVTAPILLVVLEWWPLSKWGNKSGTGKNPVWYCVLIKQIREKGVLLLMSLAVGWVTIFAQREFSALVSLETYSIIDRAIQSTAAVGWYVMHFFVPLRLSPYYPVSPDSRDWGYVCAGVIVVIVGLGWSRNRSLQAPWVLSGFGWFVVSILPVVGLIRVGEQAWADRYTYIPTIGLTWVCVWEIWELIRWMKSKAIIRREPGVCLTLVVIAVSILAGLTVVQTEYWHDPRSLWTHALSLDSKNWFAHFHLARQALRENDSQTAANHLRQCLQLRPGFQDAYLMLAALHQHQKDLKTAAEIYAAALRIYPDLAEASFNLGVIAKQEGRFDEARLWFLRCKRPDFAARLELELGQIDAEEDRLEEALRRFGRSRELDPDQEPVYESVAAVYERLGNSEEAIQSLREGMTRIPGSLRLGVTLVQLLRKHGDKAGALGVLRSLLETHSENAGLKTLAEELESEK